MASRKVIVFGPTGGAGSGAARTANELGADVVLAMRDTEKPIPGLSLEAEKQGKFTRVYADLTKPDTVSSAVGITGAKYAFIYCIQRSPDNMKATIQALKTSGIELVVFLSSFTVPEDSDLVSVPPTDVIPYSHAQVELSLREVFGSNFVALRPGSFASNSTQYKLGLQKGEVKIFGPNLKVDCIVPEDIGWVGGTILAKGCQDDKREIYLFGPQLLKQIDVVKVLAETLGIETPKLDEATPEAAYTMFVEERKVPVPIAKYMVALTSDLIAKDDDGHKVFGKPVTPENANNVEKYSGKKPTTFPEWIKQNKQLFV